MKTTANGISINYQIDGPEGAPWIVFSNSLMTNLAMWDDQAAALKNEFRVLRYDQRGHGGTDAPQGKYSFDQLVGDVVGLMDAVGVKRAHFCGLSMGGMTALFLAERHADRFDRIIAGDCGPASTPQSAQQWKERIDLGAEKGMEALVDVTVNRWYPPDFVATKAPVLDKIRGMIRTTPYQGLRRMRLCAVGFRYPAGAVRHQEPAALHGWYQGRDRRRHRGDPCCRAGLEARQARRRRAHLQYRAAGQLYQSSPGFPEGRVEPHGWLAPEAYPGRLRFDLDQGPSATVIADRHWIGCRCKLSGSVIPHW